MTVTITALGFLSQSDVELTCGQNMVLRTQMDYLAESGVEHARGLILNPQDVSGEYWTGSTGLQLAAGSDFYDVTVNPDPADRCNYIIDCNSYRLDGAEKVGRSSMRAELRLDPCIAYWVGSNTMVWPQMTIKGDIYCGGTLTNSGIINGDVFATGTISGTNPQGQKKPAAEAGVSWPGLAVADFVPTHTIVDGNVPTPGPLTGVYYGAADVNMPGNVTINGTLVVGGKLTVSGLNNVITAVKNFPALVVGGQVLMKNGSSLEINGLAQIEQQVTIDPNATNANVAVTGGLFIHSGGVTSPSIIVNVTAAPAIASIEIWPGGTRWSPAAGAFFRSIKRIK
jgi:cytoskeletal protein CcmA (bactofilin family)